MHASPQPPSPRIAAERESTESGTSSQQPPDQTQTKDDRDPGEREGDGSTTDDQQNPELMKPEGRDPGEREDPDNTLVDQPSTNPTDPKDGARKV
jgi:hypothetical protein